jgi:hypothetical protein
MPPTRPSRRVFLFTQLFAILQKTRRPDVPNLTHALAAIERHMGFPRFRSRSVARELQNAGLLSLGTPGHAPAIDREQFAALFVALAADNVVRDAPARVRQYFSMTPGGVSLEGAPASIGTARSELLALVETAIEAPGDLTECSIEVVSNFAELAVHWPDRVQRYQPTGTVAGSWQVTTHRRATIVTGSAFANAIRATFKGAD